MVSGDTVHVKQKERLLSSKEEEYERGGKGREVMHVCTGLRFDILHWLNKHGPWLRLG